MSTEKQEKTSYGLGTLDKLYQQNILDHARNPNGKQTIQNPDIFFREENLFCGDEISVFVNLEQGKIAQVAMEGEGCAVSIAAGSIMVEFLKGKSLEETFGYHRIFSKYLSKETISSEEASRISYLEMLGPVRDYPVRIKCALLCWSAMLQGIRKYQANSFEGKTSVGFSESIDSEKRTPARLSEDDPRSGE